MFIKTLKTFKRRKKLQFFIISQLLFICDWCFSDCFYQYLLKQNIKVKQNKRLARYNYPYYIGFDKMLEIVGVERTLQELVEQRRGFYISGMYSGKEI